MHIVTIFQCANNPTFRDCKSVAHCKLKVFEKTNTAPQLMTSERDKHTHTNTHNRTMAL